VLDEQGIARGGIRTPWVDVPTARLSGLGGSGETFAFLFGKTEPFDAETLAAAYPGGKDGYLEQFIASLEDAIGHGFILAADRQEILALAAAAYPG